MSKQVKPVCVAHACEMVVEKNDYRVLFMAAFGPYAVQSGDLWKCPVGGELVVSGWGTNALSNHFEDDFDTYVESADLRIEERVGRIGADGGPLRRPRAR